MKWLKRKHKPGLSNQWFIGAEAPEEKEERRRLVAGSLDILEVLKNILETKELQTYNEHLHESRYGQGDWALKQADAIGYQRALADIARLVDVQTVISATTDKGE